MCLEREGHTLRRPSPDQVTSGLVLLAASLIIAAWIAYVARYTFHMGDGSVQFDKYFTLFDLDGEGNIPAWFSSVMLLMCSILFFIAYLVSNRTDGAQRTWLGAAAAFLLLSLDEAASLHEKSIQSFVVMFFTSVLLVGGMRYAAFLKQLPFITIASLTVSFCIYLSGSLVLDYFNGIYHRENGPHSIPYRLRMTAEEGLELIGITGVIRSTLHYIYSEYDHATSRPLQDLPKGRHRSSSAESVTSS
ncbi:hypothetical protein OCOJLMKI_5164 [Methylobacterium iners]|uniref:Uncharacterized protein n=2 Tax=Methylobacterium iners TaxID=418707 RepID=A0ABQ4S475_9HYPH|nr:hypothetical protein OCOJLMKI_5164 [Methylobacterium iners]